MNKLVNTLLVSALAFSFAATQKASAEASNQITVNGKTISFASATSTVNGNSGPVVARSEVYLLELGRWGIYNDETHSEETTRGFNAALKWAHENGYKKVAVPAGTYLISKGTKEGDENARINMVSDMTLLLDDKAVIEKEPNSFKSYSLLFVGPGVKNVTLQGGTYDGDKESHDYYNGAKPWEKNKVYKVGDKVIPTNTNGGSWGYYYEAVTNGTSGATEPAWYWTKQSTDGGVAWKPVARATHEGGYGIITSGAENVTIDGIKAVDFTGDGLAIGSVDRLIDDLYYSDFKSGSVDSKGTLVTDPTKVRVENLKVTHPYFEFQRTFQFLHQRNLPTGNYVAYFYKADGTFLTSVSSADKNTPVGWGLTEIPKDASYFHVVFDTPSVPKNVYVEYKMQGVSKNVTVKNSDFSFNRRQGITVGGAKDVLIENNKIHDMKGTAPQSGIDLEAGYNLNDRIAIKNNHFYNNQAYDLILYDGRNALVEGNLFESKSIGLAISEPFKYATIQNNTFNGARIYAYNNATFKNNKMSDALAAFLGKDLVIDGFEFQDTLVNLASSVPFGIEASNITVKNTKKLHTQFGINANPIHVKNLTITGQAALDSFSGNAKDGSIFDNVKVIGFTRQALPRGTYNNCVFESAANTVYGGFEINNTGNYEFNNCTFKSPKGGFDINSVHGVPDSVIIKNSKIDVSKDNSSAISVQAGKKVSIEGNAITTGSFNSENVGAMAAIKVGNYWYRTAPTKVFDLSVKGNTITTKAKSYAVSTIHAGTGAPSYSIQNNVLNNSTLNLRPVDNSVGNIVNK